MHVCDVNVSMRVMKFNMRIQYTYCSRGFRASIAMPQPSVAAVFVCDALRKCVVCVRVFLCVLFACACTLVRIASVRVCDLNLNEMCVCGYIPFQYTYSS